MSSKNVHRRMQAALDDGETLDFQNGDLLIDGTAVTSSAAELNIMDGVTATAAEINAHTDASGRVVAVAAASTALSLTNAAHANRLVVLPVITGAGLTITLPAATGTGDKYTILNNGVQTVSVTVTALAGDIMTGLARGWHLTAGANDAFAPTAADIKYTFNVTTTGGDGGDIMELWDVATDNWFVNVDFFGSGTLATGFA